MVFLKIVHNVDFQMFSQEEIFLTANADRRAVSFTLAE